MPFTFCRRIETGPNLKERVAIQRAAREAVEASIAAGVPMQVLSTILTVTIWIRLLGFHYFRYFRYFRSPPINK